MYRKKKNRRKKQPYFSVFDLFISLQVKAYFESRIEFGLESAR